MNWAQFINWEALQAWLSSMLAKCAAQGAAPEAQEAQIRNPSIRFRVRVERQVERGAKAKGMTPRQWRAHKQEMLAAVYNEGATASKQEIQAVILASKAADPDEADELFNEDEV